MTTLTQCQQQVLDMLISYQKERGVARGITLHTAVKDDDSEAVGIIRSLLAGEENARLRAAHWLHERGLKV
ncbi:hypothetical protein F8001_RS24275 [Escherichia coli]|nr:hypothetical protein [Escherichia coli]EFM3826613.1 hypothetical protein [Escherichia coli]MEB6106067.1 hypothetical protein [Escherichia coli]